MKHTKGKWEIEYSNSDDYQGGQWYDVGPARLQIGYNPRDDERNEWTANAKLISKAPEMYEALKVLINALEHHEPPGFASLDIIEAIKLIKEIDNG